MEWAEEQKRHADHVQPREQDLAMRLSVLSMRPLLMFAKPAASGRALSA